MAVQDFYDDQTWKSKPGIANLVSWCVRHLRVCLRFRILRGDRITYVSKQDAYEDLWHLIIPPMMTLLDDYEARYRLRGVEILAEMLQVVPGKLLKKTGVDGLIRSVCKTRFILITERLKSLLVSQYISYPHPKSRDRITHKGNHRGICLSHLIDHRNGLT
jgi:hypothetical protein